MNSMMIVSLVVLVAFLYLSQVQAQGFAPSPAPGGPISDGKTVDQGIAYVLLLVALAVTYLFH